MRFGATSVAESRQERRTQICQGEVWWANLDPTVGREISKRRPCLVVSPDEMNAALATVLAAPITSALRRWPSRVTVKLKGADSFVALDQIRVLDKSRLIEKIERVEMHEVLGVLREMFRFT